MQTNSGRQKLEKETKNEPKTRHQKQQYKETLPMDNTNSRNKKKPHKNINVESFDRLYDNWLLTER